MGEAATPVHEILGNMDDATHVEADLRTAAAAVAAADAQLVAATHQLHHAIRAAFAAGLPAGPIAAATGLSKPRVYQIRDGRR